MAFLVPFQDEFCGEIRTIYAVNEERPDKHFGSHITFSEECRHCKERHFYRVYEPLLRYVVGNTAREQYLIKCASCSNIFYCDEIEMDEN
ncbi:hypothetical protein J2S25_002418 [Mesobacillus stamsii]|uniref:Uncharacterized protein n=1 Tax=Mesobacillus stamsii TaxID=225347 RepID=A0ABU0FWA5_9BACI|nr:hypothetical protein [Mesobacillus stamsii]